MGDFELNAVDSVGKTVGFARGIVVVVALVLLGVALVIAGLWLIHFCLTLPMRRAERARLFLDLLESTLKQGKPLEETLISLAKSRDLSMGVDFHLLAAWVEAGLPLQDALGRVPHFLPPQLVAMLRAGKLMGDPAKVLPAGRHLLKDAVSQTRGAISYLVLLTFVVTPLGLYVFGLLMVFVVPKFMEVASGMGAGPGPWLFSFLADHFVAFIVLQAALLLLIWSVELIYIGGPRVRVWFPILEKLDYRLPWRRRRMQRDFSNMLAVLVDAGVPEAAALMLAADCSANSVFRRRAAQAVEALRQGMKLPDAVQRLDDHGEFRWRLRNALGAPGGFLRALAGWHESLDARAFQQEQAAAHVITTSLVLWSGLFVGAIIVSVFTFLVSFINMGVLW